MKKLFRTVVSRPGQLVFQGGLVGACASFGSTMAASLFLANAGASALPIYYMLFATLSIPASLVFSGVVDRWPRRATMGCILIVYAAGAVLSSMFLGNGKAEYYVLYIVISVSEQLLYSVYFTIFQDHFTVLEAKRYVGAKTIAMGVGTVVGSLLVSLLATLVPAREVLLALPLLAGVTLAHLLWLTRGAHPLDEADAGDGDESMLESLKVLPKLARRYPIVLLMAGALFFNIAGQCVMEFEAFSIYANTHPDEAQLTAFLGKMTAFVDFTGILIVFFVSNPLIPRIGVPRMGVVPAAVNLVTFLILAVTSSLPAGILAQLNYYPLERSLNVPVFTLTYNATPHRFVGRIRVVNDGIVYSLALVAAGALLLAVEHLTLPQLAIIGAVGAAIYLLLEWKIGREYLRSLMKLLHSGVVDLSEVGEGFKLPPAYTEGVVGTLRSGDRDAVALSLQLASRCKIALADADFEAALPVAPREVALTVLGALGEGNGTGTGAQLLSLAGSPVAVVRALALEALLVRGLPIEISRLESLTRDSDETVRTVAATGLLASPLAAGGPRRPVPSRQISEDAALAALRVVRAMGGFGRSLVIAAMGAHASPAVRAQAISMAAMTATGGDVGMANWAERALSDSDVSIRAAAASLLMSVTPKSELADDSRLPFSDPNAEVRRAAALALGRRGGAGLTVLTGRLSSDDPTVVTEAMDGIGLADPKEVDLILYGFLSEFIFPTVARLAKAAKRLPTERSGWHVLAIAIADSNARAVQTILHALNTLGYKRIVGVVRTAMRTGDPRTRANAVETLSSLAHRHYVLPLLPILEGEQETASGSAKYDAEDARRLLSDLMADKDPFIRASALTVWNTEFGAIPQSSDPDPSPLVAETYRILSQPAGHPGLCEELPMNRLVFLKSVPLFSKMTLDHLMAVDAVMKREPYLEDEPVVREGDVGDKLYIVYKGEVAVRKRVSDTEERELARLTPGQVFGEMAIFDDDERRSATVVATKDSELFALDREHFYSLAYQRPDIPVQLCKVLITRLRAAIAHQS